MRNAYLTALYALAENNPHVVAVVGDNGAIVYDQFRMDFPGQFMNFGISEANMVTACAGLASCGKIPFVYTIAPFLTMRAYEQVRNDVCMQNQNVKLVGTGAGFVYSSLGPTHHGTEDLAVMRVLPNITIFSPASPMEAQKATLAAYAIHGPVYLRLGTNRETEIYKEDYIFEPGKGITLKEGNDLTIIVTGSIARDALEAAEGLDKMGIITRVINIHTIKPLDQEIILRAAIETGAIISLEEHNLIGGLGTAVAEVLMENGANSVCFRRMGLIESFAQGYGNHQDLKEINAVSRKDIIRIAREMFESKISSRLRRF
ncbi:MAG: transketolase C-terminal domain-containing protein [Bacillota bacterium]|nr:transketolase C-terminal domain-containing protein [Bacillota bacterium]